MKDQICKSVEWEDWNLLPSNFDEDTYTFKRVSTLLRATLSQSGNTTTAGRYVESTVTLKILKSEDDVFTPSIPKVFRLTSEMGETTLVGYPNRCRLITEELKEGVYSLVYQAKQN